MNIVGENKEQMAADDLINKAVKVAIKEFNRQQVAEKKRKALHNTKMLLRNYEKIKSSIDEAISEESQLKESLRYDGEDEVYINGIRKSKFKSLIVIAHIDRALEIVKEDYTAKGMLDRYEVFIDCLMKDMTYDEAAGVYFSSKPSISRWVNEVTKEISIRLFGVEGLELI